MLQLPPAKREPSQKARLKARVRAREKDPSAAVRREVTGRTDRDATARRGGTERMPQRRRERAMLKSLRLRHPKRVRLSLPLPLLRPPLPLRSQLTRTRES